MLKFCGHRRDRPKHTELVNPTGDDVLSFLTQIDLWIGKNLFVPPIIKFCHWTRQTQFAVSRLFWFIAALDGFYRADTLLGSLLFGGMSLVMMVSASRRPDMPTQSFIWLRMLAVVFLGIDILTGATTGVWAGTEFWVLVLVAEYAATIRTLPPRKTKERALAAQRQSLP